MHDWGTEQLNAWLAHRVTPPVGPLLCVIDGVTRDRTWAATAARAAATSFTLCSTTRSEDATSNTASRSSSVRRDSA